MSNFVLNWLERSTENRARLLATALILGFLSFLWVPLIVVTVMSFSGSQILSFPPDSFTTDWYISAYESSPVREATINSLQVSAVAVPLGVLSATLIAYSVERYEFRGKGLLLLLAMLPIIIPIVVLGAALNLFLNWVGVGSGFWSVVIAHTIRVIPFATLVILPSFLAFNNSLEEASLDLGADEISTLYHVTLPNVFPSILAGAALAFAISFNEFIFTLFTRDTQTTTLPIWIWNRISQGVTPEINVVSVLFIAVGLLIVLAAIWITGVERIATRSE